MKLRSIVPALTAAVMMTALLPGSAKAWVQAGALECRSAGGATFVVGAVLQFRCMFFPAARRPAASLLRDHTAARRRPRLQHRRGAGLVGVRAHPLYRPRRPCRQLWRRTGQCELRNRRRRQCTGRRLLQHLRAATVQRSGAVGLQCFRRHCRLDAGPGALNATCRRCAQSPGTAGAFVLFIAGRLRRATRHGRVPVFPHGAGSAAQCGAAASPVRQNGLLPMPPFA